MFNIFIIIIVLIFSLNFKPLDYQNAAYSIVNIKSELVRNSKKKNAIIIGGSAVRYGVDSNLISDDLYNYINFGLYAGYGVDPMLFSIDLVKNNIDRIIIMFEDDLYFTSLNKGSAMSYKFIRNNNQFLFDNPIYVKNLPAYLIDQSKGLIKSFLSKENIVPNYENINLISDKKGNSNFELENEENFVVHPDSSIEYEKLKFDNKIINYLNDLKSKYNIEVFIAFPPLLTYNQKLVIERRDYIRNKLSDFNFLDLNSTYNEKDKFFNSRWHLNSKEKVILSNRLNSLLKK